MSIHSANTGSRGLRPLAGCGVEPHKTSEQAVGGEGLLLGASAYMQERGYSSEAKASWKEDRMSRVVQRVELVEETGGVVGVLKREGDWQRADWRWQMTHRLTALSELQALVEGFEPSDGQLRVSMRYPFAVTPYYLSLIESFTPEDPIFRMAVPLAEEEDDAPALFRDPLAEEEEEHRPVAGLIHRYPDRVVLLMNGLCPVYCRHCTRKRFVGIEKAAASSEQIEGWIRYLRETPSIRDVILSGGDPLTLSDSRLERVIAAVRSVPSVEIIRIGTRIPVLMPMRITSELCAMLERYHPIWVVTHFNHPRELTAQAAQACDRLLRAGVPVNNQSVLLRGINDHPDILEALCRKLLMNRIKPYYLHQSDLVQGIEHLRTPISRGIQIMEALRGRLGGLGIPQYVIDLPRGGGKVPILPNYILSMSPEYTVLRNFEGRIVTYPEPRISAASRVGVNQQEGEGEQGKRAGIGGRMRGGVADQLAGLDTRPLIPQKPDTGGSAKGENGDR